MKQKIFIYARNVIYLMLYAFDLVFGIKPRLVIFCYHGISPHKWKYNVRLGDFKKQMDYLKEHFEFPDFERIPEIITGKKKFSRPVAFITFDDGQKNILSSLPYLKKLNVSPCIFLISDTRRVNVSEIGAREEYLNKNDVMLLHENGWSIGSHSATHPNFDLLGRKDYQREIRDSKKTLEEKLGINVKYFAYPKGRYSSGILKEVELAGYRLAFSMDDRISATNASPYTVARVGVDATHTFSIFKATFSPSVIRFRSIIKTVFPGFF